MAPRTPLTKDRIVAAAVAVADRGGRDQVSMRNVGRELGVEAMSLYHHLAGKEALLDEISSWVFGQIELPVADAPWREAMAGRAASARSVLAAHPWALGLLESRRAPGPELLRHHEAVLANLRTNGFSIALAAQAFSALDAYVHGFVLTEQNLPFEPGESAEAFIDEIAHLLPPAEYPYMREFIADQVVGGTYDYGDQFTAGLDLVLDGLERHLDAERR